MIFLDHFCRTNKIRVYSVSFLFSFRKNCFLKLQLGYMEVLVNKAVTTPKSYIYGKFDIDYCAFGEINPSYYSQNNPINLDDNPSRTRWCLRSFFSRRIFRFWSYFRSRIQFCVLIKQIEIIFCLLLSKQK